MKSFIKTRFYELPDDADIQQAFEEFEKEELRAEMEAFAFEKKIEYGTVQEIFTEYSFSGSINEENIRKRLMAYSLGLLRITALTEEISSFIVSTYEKFKAEGE